MHLELGRLTIITTLGITVRTGRYEAHIGRVSGPGRLDWWREQGAIFIRLGHYELVANPLPRPLPTAGFAAGE